MVKFDRFYGRVRVLDCYSDPLGWKDRILRPGSDEKVEPKGSVHVFKDVKDTSKLLSLILDLGKGFFFFFSPLSPPFFGSFVFVFGFR